GVGLRRQRPAVPRDRLALACGLRAPAARRARADLPAPAADHRIVARPAPCRDAPPRLVTAPPPRASGAEGGPPGPAGRRPAAVRVTYPRTCHRGSMIT